MSGVLFSGIFWGIMLVLLGISIIIKITFKIDIHIFRIVIALIFIGIGVEILLGGFFDNGKREHNIIFEGRSHMRFDVNREDNEYNIIFGEGKIDLNDIKLADKRVRVKIACVFGSGNVYINSELPVRIRVDSVFASARMPDNSVVTFGNNDYRSQGLNTDAPFIDVDADVVFGSLNFIKGKPENGGMEEETINSETNN